MITPKRKITTQDIQFIKELMDANPTWLRTRLSKELCTLWDWRNEKGQLKDMACLLFGAAAWSCADRDQFIGWDARTRKANKHLITNNARFLILPWVKVRYLASHILSQIIRRISKDWLQIRSSGLST